MTRQASALQPPGDRDLTTLPPHHHPKGTLAYRVHQQRHSPWWYASDDNGRFNLDPPAGTCYLSTSPSAAIREVVGDSLVALGYITTAFAADRILSTLTTPTNHRLADLTHTNAANHGITREISTCVPYDLPRQWATAIRRHHFDGIHYLTRFSTGTTDTGLALFGDAGQHDHPTDSKPVPLADAARHSNITVGAPPRAVTIINPPAG